MDKRFTEKKWNYGYNKENKADDDYRANRDDAICERANRKRKELQKPPIRRLDENK